MTFGKPVSATREQTALLCEVQRQTDEEPRDYEDYDSKALQRVA